MLMVFALSDVDASWVNNIENIPSQSQSVRVTTSQTTNQCNQSIQDSSISHQSLTLNNQLSFNNLSCNYLMCVEYVDFIVHLDVCS